MSVICVNALTRDYGGGKGVFDVTFQVQQGEVFGFLGPNGAGKTTTIRHLMGFLRAQQGRCTIAGLDCWKDRARIQNLLGYIPGKISFFDDMTGVEYLKFLERYRNMRGMSRKQELLDYFQLDPKGKIKKMSKGMKQKLGLVSALMRDPDILMFDVNCSILLTVYSAYYVREMEKNRTAYTTEREKSKIASASWTPAQ